MEWPDNEFLKGLFEPVRAELEAGDLPVEGRIPEALSGVYMRNGFNQQFPPLGNYHLFDGDGMIHAVYLDGGRASYRNRWILTEGLLEERRRERALYYGLAELRFPDPDLVTSTGPFKNTANTHIVRHAGRYLALWEGGMPTEVTRDLATVGLSDLGSDYLGPFTAHPKLDPDTGEMLAFGYQPFPPHVRYLVVDASGVLTTVEDVGIERPVMMHDFAVTSEHVLVFDAPAIFDIPGALAGTAPVLDWRPDEVCRVGIFQRSEGPKSIRWFEIEPSFVFHHMNAWTDGDVVTADCSRFPDLPLRFHPEDSLLEVDPAEMHRYTFDLGTGTVGLEKLAEGPSDFCRVDDRRAGKRTRYGYWGTILDPDRSFAVFDAIVKYDDSTGSVTRFRLKPTEWTGEPVFAPDPDGAAEDDGWILSYVSDIAQGTSHLHILDARDIAAGPVARVALPGRVPFGAHGSWLPD